MEKVRSLRFSWLWTHRGTVSAVTLLALLVSIELLRLGYHYQALWLLAGLSFYLLQTFFSLHHRGVNAARQNYNQIEHLFNIHAALKLDTPLPKMRNWAISPDVGSFLITKAQELKPKLIVELGSGASTLILGTIAEAWGGRVLSFEHDSQFGQETLARIRRFGLKNIELRVVPLKETQLSDGLWKWYDIDPASIHESIDLLFVDGPPEFLQKMSRYPALPILQKKLSPSAHIILDDADRVDERRVIEAWLTAFPELHASAGVPDSEAGIALLEWRPTVQSTK